MQYRTHGSSLIKLMLSYFYLFIFPSFVVDLLCSSCFEYTWWKLPETKIDEKMTVSSFQVKRKKNQTYGHRKSTTPFINVFQLPLYQSQTRKMGNSIFSQVTNNINS